MAEPFLGEIRLVGFTFAPIGWEFCNGQILSIAQNTALFSLLGTTYGGDGVRTFALPNLQGRVAVHQGNGVGLSPYVQGETYGVENVTLSLGQLPAHNHGVNASASKGSKSSPIGEYPASDAAGITAEYGPTPTGLMNANMIAAAGGNQPHENRQPSLVLNYIIAMAGIFPSRS
jgi:microcystin-dependent protein